MSFTSVFLLAIILVIGAFFRFSALQQGLSYHPDERHMIMVTMDLSDHGMNPRSFAYGSLSYYLLWVTAKCAAVFNPKLFSYDNLFIIGRSICVVAGLLGVVLTFLLAKETYRSAGIALVAAALLSFNTFHIQLSRFFTSDVLLTTLCTGVLFALVRHSRSGSRKTLLASGVLFGLATATKISSLFLLSSIALALLLSPRRQSWKRHLLSCVYKGVVLSAIGFMIFLLVEPYAFLDFSTFLQHTREQTDMVQGKWRPPYTIQYEHTTPYLYPLTQIFFYTMGIPLALAVGCGFLAAVVRQREGCNRGEWILGAWVVTLFAVTAGFQVKFPRYLMPIYPELFVFAAAVVWQMGALIGKRFIPQLSASFGLFDQSAIPWSTVLKVGEAPLAPEAALTQKDVPASKAKWAIAIAAAFFFLFAGEVYMYVRARMAPHSVESSGALEVEEVPSSIEQVLDVPNVSEPAGFRTSLREAMGLAVNSQGEVYIVDLVSNTLSKFGAQGEPIFSFGGKGIEPRQFNEPRGVSVDEQGNVYVVDTWNGRVQKFTSDGGFLALWGTAQGLFGPRAIAVKNGQVYVVDSGGGRVVIYSETGDFLRAFGKRGGKPGEFFEPVGIAVADSGSIYILDSGNDRIQKLNPDGSVAKILAVPGWSRRDLKEAHLAFSEGIGLFVVDPISSSVLLFDEGDSFIGHIAHGLESPTGVSVQNSVVTIVERRSGRVIRRELSR